MNSYVVKIGELEDCEQRWEWTSLNSSINAIIQNVLVYSKDSLSDTILGAEYCVTKGVSERFCYDSLV